VRVRVCVAANRRERGSYLLSVVRSGSVWLFRICMHVFDIVCVSFGITEVLPEQAGFLIPGI
jgi:hypothetical protein